MNIQRLAKQFNVSESALSNMAQGVKSLVEQAVKKGATLNEHLITQATKHWFELQAQYHEDLMTNKNGAKDKLSNDVYNLLKG